MAIKANWVKMSKVRGGEGITRRVFSGEKCMMVLNEIVPSTRSRLHHHPHEQLTYIIKGSAEFTLGDEVINLGEDDVVLVPPNVPHQLEVTSTEPVLNLDVFAPIREEYLPARTRKGGGGRDR
jgi:quercetin dioxygenase-like cupin family protein